MAGVGGLMVTGAFSTHGCEDDVGREVEVHSEGVMADEDDLWTAGCSLVFRIADVRRWGVCVYIYICVCVCVYMCVCVCVEGEVRDGVVIRHVTSRHVMSCHVM